MLVTEYKSSCSETCCLNNKIILNVKNELDLKANVEAD